MTARRVLTAALLLFVAASVVALVGKELRGRPADRRAPAAAGARNPGTDRQVIAYYFVGKIRCSSCRRIEQVSRTTIEKAFPRDVADGRLRFLVVNVEQPENRHFVEDYLLDSSALVLADHRGGRRTAWKNLREVWPLVDDEPSLAKYVRDEVAAMLAGG